MRYFFHVINSQEDPLFDLAYELLFAYFGKRDEMEARDVIRSRLGWSDKQPTSSHFLHYEMVVALQEDGSICAVHDYSVIIDVSSVEENSQPVVVHLSHILVLPRHQGRKLTESLRSYPIAAARRAIEKAALSTEAGIVLVAEVEHFQIDDLERIRRLKLFRLAGYKPADPSQIPYVQPDFRDPIAIDMAGGAAPLPLLLVLWRLGKEDESSIRCGEVLHIVLQLYTMYSFSIRSMDMVSAYATIESYPPELANISLDWGCVAPSMAS